VLDAGGGGAWHHNRAHRFFSATRWSADEVGLVVLRMVTGWLVTAGAPVVIAVDDTMFRRSGRKVHAAAPVRATVLGRDLANLKRYGHGC
jgi:hypothetical protein